MKILLMREVTWSMLLMLHLKFASPWNRFALLFTNEPPRAVNLNLYATTKLEILTIAIAGKWDAVGKLTSGNQRLSWRLASFPSTKLPSSFTASMERKRHSTLCIWKMVIYCIFGSLLAGMTDRIEIDLSLQLICRAISTSLQVGTSFSVRK